jgi:predicted metalloendopeptidase
MKPYWLLVFLSALAPLATAAAKDESAKPLGSGIERANFDPTVRFQDDLYRAVNGTWLAKTKIPADRADYGAFTVLAEQAEKDVRAIIESCASAGANATDTEKKVGDLYASYMDEARAEQLGIAPIAGTLAAIDRIDSKAGLVRMLAELERIGVSGMVDCSINPDAKQSDRYIVHLSQAGLGLPDRDYYLDAKYKEKLAAYEAHVARSLALCGIDEAPRAAAEIVAFETRLAKAQWTKVANRDNIKTYNKRSRAELVRLAPGFDWNLYLDAVGAGTAKELIVAQPSYFTAAAAMTDAAPLGIWRTWLKWKVIEAHASLLNRALVEEDFAFYGRTLRGIPEDRPRWKRAVAAVEGSMGEAVGKLYVARYFPPDAKQRMEALVKNIIAAYGQAIRQLDWMSASTKEKALAKLATFTPKIGYPKKWRDYSALVIRRDDLVGNLQRAATFEWNRRLARLDKPVDRDEWSMTPQTVNAYYNPSMNEIVFPAAILQPPFFNRAADDAVNYGGIGAVIGHETGHGFDDQGSKWDGAGNLADWWTAADRAEFERRSAALAAQYDRYEPLPGYHVNGRFTLGENSADLVGVTIAYAAYRRSLHGQEAPVLDRLSGDQRFFIGWAQVWRRKYRADDLKNRLLIDPHSPAEFRANGTVRNVPAFYAAFGVKPSDKMYLPPDRRVKIW